MGNLKFGANSGMQIGNYYEFDLILDVPKEIASSTLYVHRPKRYQMELEEPWPWRNYRPRRQSIPWGDTLQYRSFIQEELKVF